LSIESLRPEDSGHMSIDRSTHACVPLSHGRTRVCLAFVHVSYVHGGVRDDTTMAESCLALAPEFSRVVSFDYDDADICQSRFSWSFSCASPDSQIRRITLAKWRHMQRKERGDELHSSFCEICCRLYLIIKRTFRTEILFLSPPPTHTQRERERKREDILVSRFKLEKAGGRRQTRKSQTRDNSYRGVIKRVVRNLPIVFNLARIQRSSISGRLRLLRLPISGILVTPESDVIRRV